MKNFAKETERIRREKFEDQYTEFTDMLNEFIKKHSPNKGELVGFFAVRFLRIMAQSGYTYEGAQILFKGLLADYKEDLVRKKNNLT